MEKIFKDTLGNQADFIKAASKAGYSAVKAKLFFSKQPASQVLKQKQVFKEHFIKIVAPRPGFINADLMDFSSMRSTPGNQGYAYILTVIDIFSRYAWVFPIKTKSPEAVLPGLKHVALQLAKHGANIEAFTSDNGKEFLGPVGKYLQEIEAKVYVAESSGVEGKIKSFKLRTAIVERFNRTLSERLTQAAEVQGSTTWVPVLDAVMASYNAAEHRGIGMAPAQRLKKWRRYSKQQATQPKEPDLLDAYVRVLNDKSSAVGPKRGLRGVNQYSTDVYQVNSKHGNRYSLVKADTLDHVKGDYLTRELLVVPRPSKQQEPKLEKDKKDIKKAKKIRAAHARSGLDVVKQGAMKGTIDVVPAARFGLRGNEDSKRTRKVPSKLQD